MKLKYNNTKTTLSFLLISDSGYIEIEIFLTKLHNYLKRVF